MPPKKRKAQDISRDESPTGVLDPTLEEQNDITNTIELATAALAATNQEPEIPSKRGRGRPKGAKNKRTPTPEGDIPPEERYFFQTRQGPANAQPVSTNSFSALGLLNHDDYLTEIRDYEDPHESEMRYLHKLHARAFPQWRLELAYGYTICLYGWGSKRSLVTDFAEYLCRQAAKADQAHPKIVVINGYAHKLNIRFILNTINAVLQSSDSDDEDAPAPARLIGQPQDILDTLLSRLSAAEGPPIYLLINSLDHPSSPLRSPQLQSLLSRLSTHPRIQTIITCDTPTFNLLFPSSIRQAYNLVFHDATTFAPYDAETSVIDDVNELLGRKGRRTGGSQGISFVLKSLPENAQNLYRLLLSEILTIIADDDANITHNHTGTNGGMDDEDDETNALIDPSLLPAPAVSSKGKPKKSPTKKRQSTTTTAPEEITIEYRTLYQKASEEFICSSDMNFRFLLKEFMDHQMITSGRDAGGVEVLGVPLRRDEMEGVLEGLVL